MKAVRFDLARALALRSVRAVVVVGLLIHFALQAGAAFMLRGMRQDGLLEYPASDVATFLIAKGPTLALVCAVLAVLVVGQDYRHESRMTMVMLAGSRRRFVLAKLATVTVFSAALAVVGLGGGVAVLSVSGLASPSQIGWSSLAVLLGSRFVAMIIWSWFAAYLVFLSRSQAIAAAAVFCLPFLVEAGLGAALRRSGGWLANVSATLPFSSLDALTLPSDGTGMFAASTLSLGAALGVVAAYSLVGGLVSVRRA